MVRQQVLGRGIDNPRLLHALLATPRHLFVEEALSERAYGDGALPIGWGQTLSQAYIMARMIDLLQVVPGDRVLEVGTGSGYQSALLSQIGAEVFSMERLEPLAQRARENWRRARIRGIRIRVGDGTIGWADEAPFTAILVSAAAPAVPPALVAQLASGGRMVIPVGDAVEQRLRWIRRSPTGTSVEDHDRCSFVRLIGREGFLA